MALPMHAYVEDQKDAGGLACNAMQAIQMSQDVQADIDAETQQTVIMKHSSH